MVKPLSSFTVGAVVAETAGRKRLELQDHDLYRDYLNDFGVGVSVTVTVEEEKAHRPKTHEQVKYWFGHVCHHVSEHCGMTKEQASHYMLGECFGYFDGPGGIQIPNEPSVSALSVEKMTDLISWVLDWAPAFLEVVLLPPDKNWKQHSDRRSA